MIERGHDWESIFEVHHGEGLVHRFLRCVGCRRTSAQRLSGVYVEGVDKDPCRD